MFRGDMSSMTGHRHGLYSEGPPEGRQANVLSASAKRRRGSARVDSTSCNNSCSEVNRPICRALPFRQSDRHVSDGVARRHVMTVWPNGYGFCAHFVRPPGRRWPTGGGSRLNMNRFQPRDPTRSLAFETGIPKVELQLASPFATPHCASRDPRKVMLV